MSSKPAEASARPRRRRKSTALQRSQARLAWLMLSPALIGIAVVALYPFVKTIQQSFTDEQFLRGLEPIKWVGLQNYRDLWHDPIWRDSIVTTLKFALYTIPAEFVLGMIIALVVNSSFRGRGVIAAQMWKWMYNDIYGVVNDGLVRLHIISEPVAWIALPSTSLFAVSAVDIWKTTPFVALLLLAGLQVIPTELYEAGRIDGASAWQQFWRITLPLLRPAIAVTLIFRTLDALRVFDVFYVFFGNRPDTQTMAIFAQDTIVGTGDVGYGSAACVAIFLIIGLFTVIYVTFMRVEQQ